MSEATADTRRFGLWHAVAIAIPLGMAVAAGARDITDNSFLWHIRAGTVQISEGSVLTTDPFSFTAAGRAWRTQSWLAELLYGFLEARTGLGFVPWYVFLAAVVFFAAALLYVWPVMKTPVRVALFMTATMVLSAGFLNPRPAILSFGLFALLVLADRDRRLRWTLPLLVWVWASVHGSFVLGGLFLFLETVRRGEWVRWREAAPMFLAVFATAHGWGVVNILMAFGGAGSTLEGIMEWRHPDLLAAPFLPLLVAIGALMAAAIAGHIEGRDLWIVLPFLVVALTATRSVLPAWIGLLPALTCVVRLIPPLPGSVGSGISPRVWGALGVAAAVVTGFLLTREPAIDRERFPVASAASLTEERVFHSDGTGGYLIYAEWPGRRVYIDDRGELFLEELPEFAEARGGRPVWRDVFDRYGIREVLLRGGDPLIEILRLSGWSVTEDADGFAVARTPG